MLSEGRLNLRSMRTCSQFFNICNITVYTADDKSHLITYLTHSQLSRLACGSDLKTIGRGSSSLPVHAAETWLNFLHTYCRQGAELSDNEGDDTSRDDPHKLLDINLDELVHTHLQSMHALIVNIRHGTIPYFWGF